MPYFRRKFAQLIKEPIDQFKQSRSRSQSLSTATASPTGVLTAAAPSSPLRNLWDEALAKLPKPQQTLLLQSAVSESAIAGTTTTAGVTKLASIDITLLCALAAKQRDACEQAQLKFAVRGHKTVVLRDTAAKVIVWLDKFKQVGDVVVQYDPHHFALPWAGVRFLLEVWSAQLNQIFQLLFL
jgi:hypothetical protein